MRGAFGSYLALVRWDWAREMKRKDTVVSMMLVSLITLFLFSFALPPTAEVLEQTRGGILWVTFLLAGTIGVDRAFRGDRDRRFLEGLLLSPVSRTTLYYARVTSTLLFVLCMEAVTLVLFLVLFSQWLDWRGTAVVAAAAVAATLGFMAVGVLLSALTWSVRGGDVLLRILLFPLLIPLLAAAVSATNKSFALAAPGLPEVAVIGAFDLVFLGAGHLLFEHVVADFEGQA